MCMDNADFFDEIGVRIIFCLCNFNVHELNIVHERNSDTANEMSNESVQNNSISSVGNISNNNTVSKNNTKRVSGSTKKKKNGATFNSRYTLLKPSINFNDIENMIIPHKGSSF